MLRHLRCGPKLDAWVDGALDDTAWRRVEFHLAECVGCAATVVMIRAIKATLAAVPLAPVDRAAVIRLENWTRAEFSLKP